MKAGYVRPYERRIPEIFDNNSLERLKKYDSDTLYIINIKNLVLNTMCKSAIFSINTRRN